MTPRNETFDDETSFAPSIEVDLRIGLMDRLELQIGAGTAAVGRAGLKALLVDWERLTLAVVPTYQIQRTIEDSDGILDEEFLPEYRTQSMILPLIAGIALAPRLDLLLGADAHAGRRLDDRYGDQSGGFLALGAHLGFAVRVGKHATLLPQCGLLATVASTSTPQSHWEEPLNGGHEIDDLRRGNVLWECALGGSFGSAYTPRDAR